MNEQFSSTFLLCFLLAFPFWRKKEISGKDGMRRWCQQGRNLYFPAFPNSLSAKLPTSEIKELINLIFHQEKKQQWQDFYHIKKVQLMFKIQMLLKFSIGESLKGSIGKSLLHWVNLGLLCSDHQILLGRVPNTSNKQFLDTHKVSGNSTQFWRYLPDTASCSTGYGVSLARLQVPSP